MADHRKAIVIGAGAMGSSAAYRLARRGAAPLLLERFAVGHDRGSSHGDSRIIRLTYHAATYVRLAREAYPLWEELERDADETLFFRTGDLFFGAAAGALAQYEAVLAAEGVPFERGAAARARVPLLRLRAGESAIFQPEGGILAASRCLDAQVRAARRLGADVHENEPLLAIDRTRDPIVVETDRARYTCERLVLAGGPWTAKLAPELALPLRVLRQEVCYFAPRDPAPFRMDRFPVWVKLGAGATPDDIHYYGFPIFGRFGVKLARFHGAGPGVDPDRVEHALTEEEAAATRAFLARYFPAAAEGAAWIGGTTCLFTMTPDEDFVIDLHPDDARIAVAAGFSGHGFKFASAIGEALAGLALDGRPGVRAIEDDRARFSARRFARA